jgi:hypothetical protein
MKRKVESEPEAAFKNLEMNQMSWSSLEHQLFQHAVNEYGWENWAQVADFVGSRDRNCVKNGGFVY